jgi:recombinational DNA repair ATPase RecF
VELVAENVKMVKAVRFRPEPNLQVIAGNNGQGKTSVLDAIWWTLAGGAASSGSPEPIRQR